MSKLLLAEGPLNWFRDERVSDRYGCVYIDNSELPSEKAMTDLSLVEVLEGKAGALVCEVVRTRKSEHIGDLFRSIFPSTPNVGDLIKLGQGNIFCYHDSGFTLIGLKPNDGRLTDWLDPKQLYKVHSQTVKLYFVPADQEAAAL